jgi:hypothetical protein
MDPFAHFIIIVFGIIFMITGYFLSKSSEYSKSKAGKGIFVIGIIMVAPYFFNVIC